MGCSGGGRLLKGNEQKKKKKTTFDPLLKIRDGTGATGRRGSDGKVQVSRTRDSGVGEKLVGKGGKRDKGSP